MDEADWIDKYIRCMQCMRMCVLQRGLDDCLCGLRQARKEAVKDSSGCSTN